MQNEVKHDIPFFSNFLTLSNKILKFTIVWGSITNPMPQTVSCFDIGVDHRRQSKFVWQGQLRLQPRDQFNRFYR